MRDVSWRQNPHLLIPVWYHAIAYRAEAVEPVDKLKSKDLSDAK